MMGQKLHKWVHLRLFKGPYFGKASFSEQKSVFYCVLWNMLGTYIEIKVEKKF